MSVSKNQSRLFTGIYSGVKRSGLLNTRFGRWLFVSSYNAYKRYVEDPFHGLIEKHPELFRNGHVIDVGANIGYTSTLFARAIDLGYRVYSFEPDEANFSYLTRCAARRKQGGRIIPVRSAVGSTDGTVSLWRNEHHHGDHRILSGKLKETTAPSEAVSVPITTIDTFVRKYGHPSPISFIKIDVQGYEFAVCLGMEQTLSENPGAVVALEYSPEAMSELGFNPEEMLAWWKSKGYTASALSRKGELTRGIAMDVCDTGYVDLLFSLCHGKGEEQPA